MESISQIKGNFSNDVKITDDFVEYHVVNNREKLDAFIPFETISNDILRFQTVQKWKLTMGVIICILAVLTIVGSEGKVLFPVWILIPGIGLIEVYFRHKKKTVSLSCEKYNILLLDNPEGNEFANKIIAKRNECLRNKYLSINWENEMTNELNKFTWLRSIGAISEDEYNERKSNIISK